MPPDDAGALYKFGHPASDDHPAGENHPWMFGNTWSVAGVADDQRLIIAPTTGYVGLLTRLSEIMQDPMLLLYVLVVPRGGGEPGRYLSSEPQSREQTRRFLGDFGSFLETDGRHSLWIRSVADGAMLVYDRHNLIYAYGYLEEWKLLLRQIGMKEVAPATIKIPVPHSHHYHELFDKDEHRLLRYLPWQRSPLQEQDER